MNDTQQHTLTAPAKINLFLKVLGRRSDGYHLLDTLMVPLGLADDLRVSVIKSPAPGIDVEIADNVLPADANNLVHRAARVFSERVSPLIPEYEKFAVHIHLKKNIPIAAGLGGGSSDAAAVLQALNQLWHEPLTFSQLHELAAKLGADVPFFLTPGAAFAGGIGDVLEPLGMALRYPIILVNPGFAVSTKWVYDALKMPLTNSDVTESIRAPRTTQRQAIQARHWQNVLYNDLERVTVTAYPVLTEIKTRLLSLGADGVLMSGSGPTVFGIFSEDASHKKSQQVYDVLKKENTNWRVYLTQCLSG